MLLGGYNDPGPQAGPPLPKIVTPFSCRFKVPLLRAVGDSHSGAQVHIRGNGEPVLLCGGFWHQDPLQLPSPDVSGCSELPPGPPTCPQVCVVRAHPCGPQDRCPGLSVSTLATTLLVGYPVCWMTPGCWLQVLTGVGRCGPVLRGLRAGREVAEQGWVAVIRPPAG